MNFNLTPNLTNDSEQPAGALAANPDEMGFGEYAADIGMGVVRGVAGAGEGLYDLVDMIALDWLPDAEDNFGLGHSKTLVGGLAEGISQFMVGFVPGLGVASKLGKVAGATKAVTKLERAHRMAGHTKRAKALKWSKSFGQTTTAGMVADFTVFDAQEERLSNLIQMYPDLQNPITDFLAADEDDSEVAGRLKNLLEGGALGALMTPIVEPFMAGLRAVKAGRKARLTNQDADAAMDKVLDDPPPAPKDEPEAADDLLDDPIPAPKDEPAESTPLAPNFRPEGDPDAAAGSATKRLAETTKKLEEKNAEIASYEGRLKEKYGDGWLAKLHGNERRKVKRLRREAGALKRMKKDRQRKANIDPSGIARGATTPQEGFPLNQNTASVFEGVDETMDAQIRTSSQQHVDDLKTRSMSREELQNEVRKEVRANEEAGLGRMSMHDIEGVDENTLINITVRLKSLRDQHEGYLRLMGDYEEKAFGGTDVEKMIFVNARRNAEALQVEIKRTQEGIGRALQSMQMKGSGEIDTRTLVPKELLDPENADAMRVSEDFLKEMGGGDVVKGREMVERDIERLRRIRESHKHLPDGGRAKTLEHLADQTKRSEMLTEYWLNAILSGPITHLVNMTSNSLNTLFLPMEQALGKLSSFDIQGAKEAVGMYVHLYSSFVDAAKSAGDAFKSGVVNIDEGMGKFDSPRSTRRALQFENKTADFLGYIANLPSRALLTEDAFFKHLNYRATVRAGLAKEGVVAGKTGQELASHIEEGMQKIIRDGQFYEYKTVRTKAEELAKTATSGVTDPIEKQKQMKRFVRRYMADNWKDGYNKDKSRYNTLGDYSLLAKRARQYSREVTYTQSLDDPGRAAGVQVAAGWNRVVNNHPYLRIVTPFVRTPTNLISFFLNRSIGATFEVGRFGYRHSMKHMNLLDSEMTEALAKSSEEFADAKGRFLTGSLFMFGAGVAFNSGSITGGGPKDPEKRRMMEAQGWQPYSIRVGDTWVSYQRMDPFANFIGVVADIAEGMRESDDEDIPMWQSVLGNATAAMAKNIASKSYLTGIARISNVLANPDRYAESYLEQTAASMLPFSSFAGQTWAAKSIRKNCEASLMLCEPNMGWKPQAHWALKRL